jgi:hypothetical protein
VYLERPLSHEGIIGIKKKRVKPNVRIEIGYVGKIEGFGVVAREIKERFRERSKERRRSLEAREMLNSNHVFHQSKITGGDNILRRLSNEVKSSLFLLFSKHLLNSIFYL